MSQLLSVGTKVVLEQSEVTPNMYRTFHNVIGTITKVVNNSFTNNTHYVINWDKSTSLTYKAGNNPNQFNVTAHRVKLYKPVDKKEAICNKVLQLQKKFNERKLSYDF